MIATPATANVRRSGASFGLQLGIALGLPFLGAVTVAGIYLGQEIILTAAWAALFVVAFIFVDPLAGIVILSGGFLLAAYPTVLQALGFLSLANLLGVVLGVLLVAHVLGTRDLSFLKPKQFLVLAAIGIILLLGTANANALFPTLQTSTRSLAAGAAQATAHTLDKTTGLLHDFFTQLAFLVFFSAFVRDRRGVRAVFLTFMIVLFAAVGSALINWWQGTLAMGFRVEASVTAGANANRLAMICLMEVACWWYWAHWRPGRIRLLIAGVAMAASTFVVVATGSRSGLLGCLVLVLLLEMGPRRFRVPLLPLGMLALLGALAVVTVVPPDAWQRALRFSTEDPHAAGTSSIVEREDTVRVALQMFHDHPFLGVGIGNFKEVSRQVYQDQYYRSPHNSYAWAAAEGGVFVLGAYLLLFAITWRELKHGMRLSESDTEIANLFAALRAVFVIYCFFAVFADIWVNPLTYVMLGMIISTRRYMMSQLAGAAPVPVGPRQRRMAALGV